MDMTAFKRWCCANIIWPGVALVDDNGTNEPPPPSCHLPASQPPGGRLLDFMEDNWLIVLFVTLSVVISVGVVLGVHHMRWKRALKRQLDLGNVDQDQYERLR